MSELTWTEVDTTPEEAPVATLVQIEYSNGLEPETVNEFCGDLPAAFRYCHTGMESRGASTARETRQDEFGAHFTFAWITIGEDDAQ